MNKIAKSSCAFFMLFFIGSIAVEFVQSQSVDSGRVFASAVIGILATVVFAAFGASDKANH